MQLKLRWHTLKQASDCGALHRLTSPSPNNRRPMLCSRTLFNVAMPALSLNASRATERPIIWESLGEERLGELCVFLFMFCSCCTCLAALAAVCVSASMQLSVPGGSCEDGATTSGRALSCGHGKRLAPAGALLAGLTAHSSPKRGPRRLHSGAHVAKPAWTPKPRKSLSPNPKQRFHRQHQWLTLLRIEFTSEIVPETTCINVKPSTPRRNCFRSLAASFYNDPTLYPRPPREAPQPNFHHEGHNSAAGAEQGVVGGGRRFAA